MESPRKRSVPRPYNPTRMRPSVKRDSVDWEPVSLRDLDVSWELNEDEVSSVRPRIDIAMAMESDDDIELPPISTWVEMNLPLPVPRPRNSSY